MERSRARIVASTLFVVFTLPIYAQVNVTTYHNDNARTGQNTQETVLTPSNVVVNKFGRLFSVTVDGQVYAQPLVLSNVSIGGGTHNVVYVATENDSVYAIDASAGAIYWSKNLGSPVPSSELPSGGCGNISPSYGITSTPTIDPATGTFYVVTSILRNGEPAYQLHALAVTTGAEKFGGPVGIGGSSGSITFSAKDEHIRAGLLLENGHIIIGSGSHCDNPTWYGWIMSYSASTLLQEAIFNTEPTGNSAGVWMSGGGVAADASGNIYFATGNSAYESGTDLGDSIVKLSPPISGFSVLSYFTPSESYLTGQDMDVGSGGVLLLPNTSLLVQMGKPGDLFLVNQNAMGGYCSTCNGDDTNIVQEVQGASVGLWGSPAYWNGNVYFSSAREPDYLGSATADSMKAYSFNANGSGKLSTGPTSVTPGNFSWPSPTPSVSANGTTKGIVWALDNSNASAQVLYAYDATNLATKLYDTNTNGCGADHPGGAVKFSVPTVANGKVYVGSSSALSVFGILPPDFCLGVTPTSQTINDPFGYAYFSIGVVYLGGFTGAVSLNASCPWNLTCSIAGSTLTVHASSNLPGTWNIPITGTSGSLQHTATIQVTVAN